MLLCWREKCQYVGITKDWQYQQKLRKKTQKFHNSFVPNTKKFCSLTSPNTETITPSVKSANVTSTFCIARTGKLWNIAVVTAKNGKKEKHLKAWCLLCAAAAARNNDATLGQFKNKTKKATKLHVVATQSTHIFYVLNFVITVTMPLLHWTYRVTPLGGCMCTLP